MTRSFNCASCSAPLEFEGNIMQKCRYCGSTVIAPHEMFYAASAGDFSSLTGKALKIAEINQLVHDGKKLEAIKLFRETFGVGLAEAKDAVERMERGDSVDISGMSIRSSRRATPQELDAVKKIGYTVGGSILVTVIASFLIVGAIILAIFYFAWSTVSNVVTVASNTTTTPVATPAKPTPTLDAVEKLKFGGEGNGAGRFKDNRHVAVDGRGRIYSSDYSPFRIQVFDSEGKFLNQWAASEGSNLYDLFADRDGNLFVVNDRGIFKFEGETGKQLAKSERIYVQGAALTWDNKIVAVYGKALLILDKDLKIVGDFRDAGDRANTVSGFSKLAVDGAGTIYVTDNHNDDICKFAPDGKFLNRFPSHTRSSNAIAIDPKGRIFISNTSDILVLDPNGALLKTLDSNQAFGLAFDQQGALYVASRPFVLKYDLTF